jgi:hypothetical protein
MRTLSTDTKMKIGYKFEVTLNNGTKIMAGRGRQIMVTVSNDLFNVYAFTLRGVNMTKEVSVNGVFADQLEETIIKAFQS